MIIKDSHNNLLGIKLLKGEVVDKKYFATENSNEMQLASFNLEKGEEIIRHHHPNQERNIKMTSEVIVVLKGEIKVDLYDLDLNYHSDHIISEGEVIALFSGGHGITITENAEFIEVKQGPYNPDTDKEHF